LDKQGNLILEMAHSGPVSGSGSPTFKCKRIASCSGKKIEQDNTIRAVFIRPCEGQLFESFGFTKGPPGFPVNPQGDTVTPPLPGFPKRSTRVGGSTVGSVCKDLKDSGVTDVFLPFKVDHEGKGCGDYGELLYDSKEYPERVSPSFRQAIEKGFDPIAAIIKECKKQSSRMRFHAWFPVFADRYAAQDAPIIGQTTSWILFKNDNPKCKSKIFADPKSSTVAEYEFKLLDELFSKYPDIKGLNLDYIRYPDLSNFRESIQDTNGFMKSECEAADFQVSSEVITDFVRQVRKKYPKVVLSADVMASQGRREALGQEGILIYLDWVMPMEYTKMGVSPGDIGTWIEEIKKSHSDKRVISDLRGWVISQTGSQLLDDLTRDIKDARQAGANGYAIFTYESLLSEAGIASLKSVRGKIKY